MTEAELQQLENEKKRKELAQAYRRLSMTDDGKTILKDLESFCGFNNTSTNVEWNPYQTMFAEGKRRVFLRINNLIRRKEDE